MARLCDEKKLVPIFASANINAGADSDSIDMKDATHIALLCMFGPSMAGAAGPILKLYEGAADATKTTALTFNYRYGGAAIASANADVLSTEATSAALQIATATLLSRLLVIELDAEQMTDGCDWLTLEVGAEADAGELTVVAVLDTSARSMALDSVLD